MKMMAWLWVALLGLAPGAAGAMEFVVQGESCRVCDQWILATGEITEQSADQLRQFLKTEPYAPKVLRLDSPGGSLLAGIQLGMLIRELEMETEAIACASACLYAFLGGTARSLVGSESRLGIHRFYDPEQNDPASIYTGEDLDSTQRLMAALLYYTIYMGVDPGLIALSSDAGPEQMRWLTPREARDLKVLFDAKKWDPWEIVGGNRPGEKVVAQSTTQDKTICMEIECTKDGLRIFRVVAPKEYLTWFKQCAKGTFKGWHPVLGLRVAQDMSAATQSKDGMAVFGVILPPGPINPSKVALFNDMEAYSMSCMDTQDTFAGTGERLVPLASLIFDACQ